MKRLFTLVLLLLSIVSFAQTQNPVLEWEKTYGGTSHEGISIMISSSDGGYLLGGYSQSEDGDVQSGNKGNSDYWVVKINSVGNIEWEKSYGGSSYEYLNSMVSTSDGGYLLGGNSRSDNGDIQSGGHEKSDYWVIKISSTGSIEWEETYGSGIYFEYLNSMVSTSDGGYLLGGYTSSMFDGDNYWVIKINSLGNIEWEKTYGGSSTDNLNSMISTSDGGYLLGGFTGSNDEDIQSGNEGKNDYWVVKIDSLGTIEWEKTYGGSENDYLFSIISVSDGGYLLGGRTDSNDGDIQSGNHGSSDYWVIKINSTGEIEWENTYGGSVFDILYSMISTSDGGYLLGGHDQQPDWGDHNYWVIKINSIGTIEWEEFYGGSDWDELHSMISTSDGAYLLGGSTMSNDGDIQSGNQGKKDFWVLKINVDNTTGIETLNDDIKIYPNPIIDNLTIETPFSHPVQLNIIDIHGKTILVQDLFQSSNQVFLKHIPDGLYFVLLIDNAKIIYQQRIIKRKY